MKNLGRSVLTNYLQNVREINKGFAASFNPTDLNKPGRGVAVKRLLGWSTHGPRI